jgi:hypothetical protein
MSTNQYVDLPWDSSVRSGGNKNLRLSAIAMLVILPFLFFPTRDRSGGCRRSDG